MGFLVHLVPGIVDENEITAYRVTVTDVFGGEISFDCSASHAHQAHANPGNTFTPVEAFREAGATVTPHP
ncbi:hypothetical protein SUDANB140_03744 [Streptomyces sp. enrichment culture]